MHKKRSKICIRCRVSEAKFYLYHSTKIANARPRFDEGIFDSYVHLILVVLDMAIKFPVHISLVNYLAQVESRKNYPTLSEGGLG